ncbi:hypothetical protein O181_058220 [Austropuccinia psidii MF-1]|uniref:Uncharacterized protein n=1 Tax=Austropuccinia psidii MF-1 TaxID=1389203 RepID=A0A9Q3E996_9BASI|nr:hypothetical protein [Austropuccinia psidii MF-1]
MGHKQQVGPPESILPPNSNNPKMAKRTTGPQSGHNEPWTPLSTHDLWQPPGATISGPDPVPKDSFVVHIWYNIPFCTLFLRNPMVMFSGPKYVISSQIPKSTTHFKGRIPTHSALQSLNATRSPFEDPNHLSPKELGCYFISGLFKG